MDPVWLAARTPSSALSPKMNVFGIRPHAPPRDRLGQLRLLQDRIQEAVASLERAVALQPFFPQAHYNLALVYHRRGRPDAAQRESDLYLSQAASDESDLYSEKHFKFSVAQDDQ